MSEAEKTIWLNYKYDDASVEGGFSGSEFPKIWPPRCHCQECGK